MEKEAIINEYIRNKVKYFILKEPTFSFMIQDVQFNLICKYLPDESRPHIILSSVKGKSKGLFTYYKSNSQGMWRFCYQQKPNYYEKGSAYTCTTLVHIELQIKINEYYDRIPLIEFPDYPSTDLIFSLCKRNY